MQLYRIKLNLIFSILLFVFNNGALGQVPLKIKINELDTLKIETSTYPFFSLDTTTCNEKIVELKIVPTFNFIDSICNLDINYCNHLRKFNTVYIWGYKKTKKESSNRIDSIAILSKININNFYNKNIKIIYNLTTGKTEVSVKEYGKKSQNILVENKTYEDGYYMKNYANNNHFYKDVYSTIYMSICQNESDTSILNLGNCSYKEKSIDIKNICIPLFTLKKGNLNDSLSYYDISEFYTLLNDAYSFPQKKKYDERDVKIISNAISLEFSKSYKIDSISELSRQIATLNEERQYGDDIFRVPTFDIIAVKLLQLYYKHYQDTLEKRKLFKDINKMIDSISGYQVFLSKSTKIYHVDTLLRMTKIISLLRCTSDEIWEIKMRRLRGYLIAYESILHSIKKNPKRYFKNKTNKGELMFLLRNIDSFLVTNHFDMQNTSKLNNIDLKWHIASTNSFFLPMPVKKEAIQYMVKLNLVLKKNGKTYERVKADDYDVYLIPLGMVREFDKFKDDYFMPTNPAASSVKTIAYDLGVPCKIIVIKDGNKLKIKDENFPAKSEKQFFPPTYEYNQPLIIFDK